MRLSGNDGQSKIDLIAEWKASGLSQKEFCQQRNIPAHVFYYWHKCYRRSLDKSQESFSSASDFVELTANSHAAPALIELHLPNGMRIAFHQQVSAEYLKALIR